MRADMLRIDLTDFEPLLLQDPADRGRSCAEQPEKIRFDRFACFIIRFEARRRACGTLDVVKRDHAAAVFRNGPETSVPAVGKARIGLCAFSLLDLLADGALIH